MSKKESPKDVITAYRRQQARSQRAPKIILFISAVVIVVVAAALIFNMTGDAPRALSLSSLTNIFASKTPTATVTLTPTPVTPSPTPTESPTNTPTPTETPTITLTPTIPGPFIYTVQEGDAMYLIAQENEIDILVLIEVNRERLGLNPANPIIRVGDELLIPPPGTKLATATPLPEGLARGTQIEYTVQPGDSLAAIAAELNSTVESILEENGIEDANAIFVGQTLIVRVNLVTPVPTVVEELAITPTPTP